MSNPLSMDGSGYIQISQSLFDNVGNSVMTGQVSLINIFLQILPIFLSIFVFWLIIRKGIPFLLHLFNLVRFGNDISGDSVYREHISYDKDGKEVKTITIDKTSRGGFNDF